MRTFLEDLTYKTSPYTLDTLPEGIEPVIYVDHADTHGCKGIQATVAYIDDCIHVLDVKEVES